ncbi:hypothetical protein F442_12292 [Phytophthora nicotianae P10297]|uniref:Uncharacterized protein n=1 Tax=Phytophthora nicotianae P10297 TaxID=1317064 RepID=W2YYY4_PHYNI|nr:hypothetical protein F442_12292 [Phytophthora nicotianae P10297]
MSFNSHETRSSFADSFVRWPLRDCSGVHDPLPEKEMASWFARWSRTRSKPVTETLSVTQRSLDQAWTAFVLRWNVETGPRFRQLIEAREETHQRYALGELAERMCTLSWNEDRPCCYVHHLEGCVGCERCRVSRPSDADWAQIVVEYPMTEEESRPPQAPERLREEWSGVPSCRSADRSTAPGNGESPGYSLRSVERCDYWPSHRGPEWPPRYDEGYHRGQQEGLDRHEGTDRDWKLGRRLERLEQRVEQLERENRGLRQEM